MKKPIKGNMAKPKGDHDLRLDHQRQKNREWFNDFMHRNREEFGDQKESLEDEITVKWYDSWVGVNLCGYISMTIQVPNDNDQFEWELKDALKEMRYNRLEALQQSNGTKEKAEYLMRRKRAQNAAKEIIAKIEWKSNKLQKLYQNLINKWQVPKKETYVK